MGSWIIWFISELRCAYHESFDSDRDFGARIVNYFYLDRDFDRSGFVNHLIYIRTSVCISWIIWFRSGLRSSYSESFDLDRDFDRSGFVNHLIYIRTSECVSWIIWSLSGLWASITNHLIQIGTKRVRKSFDSDQIFRARIANHLI